MYHACIVRASFFLILSGVETLKSFFVERFLL